jgi:hypothetical protein
MTRLFRVHLDENFESCASGNVATVAVALPLNRGLCGCRGICIPQIVDSNQGVVLKSRTKLSDAGRETVQPLRRI